MGVNRDELARRIAHRGGFNIGDIKRVLSLYEDIVVEAIEDDEEVKHGKLYKLSLKELPEKKAYNGLDKQYFIRENKKVPKIKLLSRLTSIEVPIKKDETGE